MRALIVSDGRKGHENQSIAFCKIVGADFEVVQVRFRFKFAKAFSYLFDWLGIYTKSLFKPFCVQGDFDLVVSAGSSTYYASKLLAKRLKAKSVALMKPKGFRRNFDLVFAQRHDGGELPINFALSKPAGLVELGQNDAALIVGGSNKSLRMHPQNIKEVVEFIFKNFSGKKAVTTSPRTPKAIEELIEAYPWDFKVIYSKEPINPIGDFMQSGYLFVTQDSTSMVSEAVSGGRACVEVVPLEGDGKKYAKMIDELAKEGYVHIFEGSLGKANKKIDWSFVTKRVRELF